MTFEELKAKAERQGYILYKKQPCHDRFLLCKCGFEGRMKRKWDDNILIRTCPKCGYSLTIDHSKSKYRLESAEKAAWNEAMGRRSL